jgi:hypothetical protein
MTAPFFHGKFQGIRFLSKSADTACALLSMVEIYAGPLTKGLAVYFFQTSLL